MARSAVVTAVEAAVREEMDKNDASHDFSHIERVRNMALTLAREEVSG
jgi:HD superfamily phosphodiesterase